MDGRKFDKKYYSSLSGERERGIETQRLSISFFLSIFKIKREQIEMDNIEENIYSIILLFFL